MIVKYDSVKRLKSCSKLHDNVFNPIISHLYNWPSRSHRDAQLGNGVHFIWKRVPRPKFDAEIDGADRFLKNGAQSSIMAT